MQHDSRRHDPRNPPSSANADAPAPGKQTLPAAEGSEQEHAIAREGLRDGATELPYRAELEQSLGSDLAHVKAYAGPNARAASNRLGAHAYAMRDEQAVVLGDAQPTKELVAHEVVHTMQLGRGSVSQDETEADSIGAQLAAGVPVDKRSIKSGGGRVRKKSFRQLFDNFLAGQLESTNPVMEEWHPGGHMEKRDASATLEGKLETTALGGMLTVEEKIVVGKTKSLQQLVTVVAAARQSADDQVHEMRWKELDAQWQRAQLQVKRDELDQAGNLDHGLVGAYRASLDAQLAAADRRIVDLRAAQRACQKMVDAIDKQAQHLQTALKDPAASDPVMLASNLAVAEATFQATSELTSKRTFGFDLLAGSITRGRAFEATEHRPDGSVSSGESTSTKYKVGKGASRETETKRTRTQKDKAGETVRATEIASSTTNSLLLDDAGAVGYGRGQKLSGAIENTHGKATGDVGYSGAVTTNIVEVPQGEGQDPLYAVVVTINLGLAIAAGLEKEGGFGGKDIGQGPDKVQARDKAKAQAKLAIQAAADAQFTQTHLLDAAGVKAYLAKLDTAGEKPHDDKPEFGVLYKAMNGADVGQLVKGAAAVFSSSDCAKDMKVDESVELTTKVSGGADVSVGAAGVGLSGGGSMDLYRTMKIGRVKDKGRELVEVSISFGSTSEMHGALTGAALGVTASAGMKAWNSGVEAVTFRLDDKEGDYAFLYDQIVQTTSREELLRMRTSDRMSKHVLSYSSKQTDGSDQTFGIGSDVIGMAEKESKERGSDSGMVDGVVTHTETGSQTSSIGFTVGPLEALRRTQKDQAAFEIQDGVSTLDISELTNQSWIGQWEMDSPWKLVTADSPLAAIQEAITKQRKQLDGFLLDPEDLDVLVEKARTEPEAWNNVATWVEPTAAAKAEKGSRAAAWRMLRLDLIRPEVQLVPGVPPSMCRDLAIGKLICDFMTTGEQAKNADYLRVVLRNWRVVGGMDGTAGGSAYEFPSGLDAATYKNVRRKCKGLDVALAAFVGVDDGASKGLVHVSEVQFELAKAIKAVEDHTEFTSERTRFEMIAELRMLASDIPKQRREFLRRCSDDDIVMDDQADMDAIADAKSQTHHIEATLEHEQVVEAGVFYEVRGMQRDKSWFSIDDHIERVDELRERTEEQYRHWILLVKQLRAAYKAARIPESSWKVSARASDQRRALDFDFETAKALLVEWAYSIRGSSLGVEVARRDWEKLRLY